MEIKTKECFEKIGALLEEYNCTLEIVHTIAVSPKKVPKNMDENEVKEESLQVEDTVDTLPEETKEEKE